MALDRGESFAGEYISRVGNLVVGLLDSVSGSVEAGLQIKGKVNAGPLLNATATLGVINASLATSAAANVDLNVRVPSRENSFYHEVSAGAGNLKFGVARDSVVDGISVRRGPYEDAEQGFFFSPTAKAKDAQWGKVGLHLQIVVGGRVEVDFRKIGTALTCAFD